MVHRSWNSHFVRIFAMVQIPNSNLQTIQMKNFVYYQCCCVTDYVKSVMKSNCCWQLMAITDKKIEKNKSLKNKKSRSSTVATDAIKRLTTVVSNAIELGNNNNNKHASILSNIGWLIFFKGCLVVEAKKFVFFFIIFLKFCWVAWPRCSFSGYWTQSWCRKKKPCE